MKIVVFGASGKVGRLVVAEALQKGHSVTAFVHSHPDLPKHSNLQIIQGDVYSADDVNRAVDGSDAVISALGSWGTKDKDVVDKGMANIIAAMRQHSVKRVISLTGAGARSPGDTFNIMHSAGRLLLKIAAPKILRDGEAHIRRLSDNNLDWTVVRSPGMINLGSSANWQLSPKCPWPLAVINRQSVAVSLINLAETRDYNRQAPFISRAGHK